MSRELVTLPSPAPQAPSPLTLCPGGSGGARRLRVSERVEARRPRNLASTSLARLVFVSCGRDG